MEFAPCAPKLPLLIPVKRGGVQCTICLLQFRNAKVLRKHQAEYHLPNGYVCPYCGLDLTNRFSFESHLSTQHPDLATSETLFCSTCEICGQSFQSPAHVEAHKKVAHSFSANRCQYCSEVFPSVKTVYQHMRNDCLNREIANHRKPYTVHQGTSSSPVKGKPPANEDSESREDEPKEYEDDGANKAPRVLNRKRRKRTIKSSSSVLKDPSECQAGNETYLKSHPSNFCSSSSSGSQPKNDLDDIVYHVAGKANPPDDNCKKRFCSQPLDKELKTSIKKGSMSESSNSGTSQKKPTAESTSRYNDNLPPPKPTKSRRKEKEKVRADFGSSNEPEVGIRRIDIVDVEADDDDIEYLDGDTDEEEECDFLTVENEDQMEDAASLMPSDSVVGLYVARGEAFIQLELVPPDKVSSVLIQLRKFPLLAECPFCEAKFSFRESFEFHMKKYHKRFAHRVSLPDAGTGEEAEEIAYETLEYETQMKCPACELFFPSAPQMVEHFDLESEQKLICGQCQKSRKNIASFPHEWGLTQHKLSNHILMSFEARQCKYCGKEFPTGLKCAKHIFKEHRCELNVVEVGDVEASEEEDLGDADDLMLVVKTEPISAEEEDS